MVHDILVDTFFEENIIGALETIGSGRLVMDPKDPEEPYLTYDGYLVVRIKEQDPIAFSRELERRVSNMRIVKTVLRKE